MAEGSRDGDWELPGNGNSSATPLWPMEEVSTHKGILKHGKFCALSSILISQEVPLASHSSPLRRKHDDVTQAVIHLSPV